MIATSVLLLPILQAVFGATQASAAVSCPDTPPRISTMRILPPPVIDGSLTQVQLQKISPYHHGGRALGLYNAEINARTQTFVGIRWDDRQACLWIDRVETRIEIGDRRIYVIRERKPGTCEHSAVLEHEKRHQAVDDAVVADFVPRLEEVLASRAAEIGMMRVPADEREAAQARMTAAMGRAFKQAMEDMLDERTRRQKAIDTPIEYRRVNAACDPMRDKG